MPLTFADHLRPAEAATPRGTGTVMPVPKEIALAVPKRPDGTRRVWIHLAKLEPYQAKIQGNGRGGYFVAVNRQRVAALEASFSASRKPIARRRLKVKLTPDLSKYGLPVPVELEHLLAEDPRAHDYFEGLSPQQQRRILYGIGAPKTEATRLRKAVATVEYLHAVRGEVDLEAWTEALRTQNPQ